MKKSYLKIVIYLAGLLMLAQCSGFSAAPSGTQTQSSVGPSDNDSGGGGDFIEKMGFLPGVVRQTQILPAFTKCLGLSGGELSTQTKNIFQELKGNLSEEGKVSDLSGPMLMAVTQLAGEVCNDLIAKERVMSQPQFFTGFNLASVDATGSSELSGLLNKMSKSCWGRQASDLEKNLIIENYVGTSLGDNRGSRGALFLCTVMMSSTDVLLY